MIKIHNTSSVSVARSARKKTSSTSASDAFSSIMDILGASHASSSSAVATDMTISSMDMILSVQGVPSSMSERQQHIRNAELTLDALDALRNGLLVGAVPNYLLHDIERRMSIMRSQTTDPDLINILEDIELRAAVELAKFTFDV
jgi:Class II flagellar assembly regulator